jgi:glutathione S-transferase
MPMNIRRSSPGKGRAPGVEEDIDRVCEVWNDCRSRHGEGGAFLFGAYCLADVFFAPVVSRFNTYDVDLDRVSRSYASAVWEQPDVREWRRAAEAEEWVESEFDL